MIDSVGVFNLYIDAYYLLFDESGLGRLNLLEVFVFYTLPELRVHVR